MEDLDPPLALNLYAQAKVGNYKRCVKNVNIGGQSREQSISAVLLSILPAD